MIEKPHSRETVARPDRGVDQHQQTRATAGKSAGFASAGIQLLIGMLVGHLAHGPQPIAFLLGFGCALALVAWLITAIVVLIGGWTKQAWLRHGVILSWVVFGGLVLRTWISAQL